MDRLDFQPRQAFGADSFYWAQSLLLIDPSTNPVNGALQLLSNRYR